MTLQILILPIVDTLPLCESALHLPKREAELDQHVLYLVYLLQCPPAVQAINTGADGEVVVEFQAPRQVLGRPVPLWDRPFDQAGFPLVEGLVGADGVGFGLHFVGIGGGDAVVSHCCRCALRCEGEEWFGGCDGKGEES